MKRKEDKKTRNRMKGTRRARYEEFYFARAQTELLTTESTEESKTIKLCGLCDLCGEFKNASCARAKYKWENIC